MLEALNTLTVLQVSVVVQQNRIPLVLYCKVNFISDDGRRDGECSGELPKGIECTASSIVVSAPSVGKH